MRNRYGFKREYGYIDRVDGICDSFCWTNGIYKLRYFRPCIDTFDSDSILDMERGENRIYTFDYYMQLLMCEKNGYEKDSETWKVIIDAAAYDFPNALNLKDDLVTVMDSDMADAQIVRGRDGKPYEKVLSIGTEGHNIEDGYVVRRIMRYPEQDGPDKYELEIGTNYTANGGGSHFVRLTDLSREDIRSLYTCVKRFIEFAEDWYNLGVKTGWERAEHNKYIDGEILVCTDQEALIAEGDVISSLKYWDFHGEKILESLDESVTGVDSDGGMVSFENTECLYLDAIYCIDPKIPDDEILHWGISEIAQDFYDRILTKTERMLEDFKSRSTEELYSLYGEYIDNRYAMCREEHGFEVAEDAESIIAAVRPYVEKVICRAKKGLPT